MDGQDEVRALAAMMHTPACGLRHDPPGRIGEWPPSEPAVFTNLTRGWRWGERDAFLVEMGSWEQPLSTFVRDAWLRLVDRAARFSEHPVKVPLRDYVAILRETRSNVFVFAREEAGGGGGGGRGGAARALRRRFFEALGAGYQAPPGFAEAVRIFAMDGVASGHGMHRHREAWLAQLVGRKVWWVAPPLPSGREAVGAVGHPSFPYRSLSPEEGAWPCAWLLREELASNITALRRCVQMPGEVLVLPTGWWHMTCSLDEFNIAVGGQGV